MNTTSWPWVTLRTTQSWPVLCHHVTVYLYFISVVPSFTVLLQNIFLCKTYIRKYEGSVCNLNKGVLFVGIVEININFPLPTVERLYSIHIHQKNTGYPPICQLILLVSGARSLIWWVSHNVTNNWLQRYILHHLVTYPSNSCFSATSADSLNYFTVMSG